MKRLYLGSSISNSAKAIAKDIGKSGLTLSYITTASEPEVQDLGWLEADKKGLRDAGFIAKEFTVTGKSENEVETELSKSDAILVGGGNTFYLLDQMRKSGADRIIREMVEKGKIYIGSSAGSVIAGPDISSCRGSDDPSVAPDLKDYKGLGLVDFVVFPHWGSEIFRESYKNTFYEQNYNDENKIILIGDFQYIRVEDDCYRILNIPH